MIRAYGMRGLFGRVFSRGIDEFAEKLKQIVESVDVRGFGQWDSIRHEIEDRHLDTKIVLFGHSMGANRATDIAWETPKQIHLLIAFDPTIWWPIQTIGSNVDRAICFYGRGPSVLGRGQLTASATHPKITNIPSYLLHSSIDDDDISHSTALDAVMMLKSTLAKKGNGNG